LPASVRQRLLNWSQRQKFDFQYALTRYGIEHLLYRLSRSPFRDGFVLKGAMLFAAWEGWSPRPTAADACRCAAYYFIDGNDRRAAKATWLPST
jgi:hypothetical protein